MKLIKDLSEIFSEYLPSDLKFDIACRAICRDLKASSATILIYQGKEEILKCTGRYIDPLSAVENYNNNTEIESVLKQIGYLELMDLRERKILDESVLKGYKRNPLYSGQNRNLGNKNLKRNTIKKLYDEYKEVLKSEWYDLNTENSPTIQYYKDLFSNANIDDTTQKKVKILYLNRDDENFKNHSCITKIEERFNISLYIGYYIVVPLFSKGRIFGVLMMMFPKKKLFNIRRNADYILKYKFIKRASSVCAALSSLVNFELFVSDYKKTLFFTDVDITNENIKKILSNSCEMLSELIRCKGAILRHLDDRENERRWLIIESTKNLDSYKDYMNNEYRRNDFFKDFAAKFNSDPNMQAVSFSLNPANIKTDGHVIEYFLSLKNEDNVISSVITNWNLRTIFSNEVLYKLRAFNIDKALIFRLKDYEQSFIIFFNTPTKDFSTVEADLIHPLVNNLSIHLYKKNFFNERKNLRNLIHEIISSLTAMQQFAKNIQQKIYPPDKIDEKLGYLSAQSRMSFYFAQNYQRLLDLEKGGIQLNKTRINLKSYLIALAIDYQPMARAERGISVHVLESMGEDIYVEIDRFFFDHVIRNLIHNAVKYSYTTTERLNAGLKQFPDIGMYDKENIYISAYEKLDKVIINISSWGLPMSAEERKKIFSRGFRGQKAIDRNPVGTDIGCWIASEIVKLHGGKLELEESERDDRFVFRIELQKG